jgi:hypothetical protein
MNETPERCRHLQPTLQLAEGGEIELLRLVFFLMLVVVLGLITSVCPTFGKLLLGAGAFFEPSSVQTAVSQFVSIAFSLAFGLSLRCPLLAGLPKKFCKFLSLSGTISFLFAVIVVYSMPYDTFIALFFGVVTMKLKAFV